MPLRGVVDALLYSLRTTCPWRLLPRDFPNRSTVQRFLFPWEAEGLGSASISCWSSMPGDKGPEARPSAVVIDSQSVKTTKSHGLRGYDASKKVSGRERHIITDTNQDLVGAQAHAPDVQESRRREATWADQCRSCRAAVVQPEVQRAPGDSFGRGLKNRCTRPPGLSPGEYGTGCSMSLS